MTEQRIEEEFTLDMSGPRSFTPQYPLDSGQQEIVDYEGSCLVVGPPGGRKTSTLVAKAGKLWSEGKDVVVLTFTRAAAQELKQRMPGIPAMTVHRLCYELIGWTGSYDSLILDVLKSPIPYKYDYVLVDEAQDLTAAQLAVILKLYAIDLFMVGDPLQSIYGFAGALGQEILRIHERDDFKLFHLKRNYRSRPEVVEQLNRICPRDLISFGEQNFGTSAVLLRTNAEVRMVSELLTSKSIGHSVRMSATELEKKDRETIYKGSELLFVMTLHCCKGLGFDSVGIYKWKPQLALDQDRNLYYVGVSRASRKYLYLDNEAALLKFVGYVDEEVISIDMTRLESEIDPYFKDESPSHPHIDDPNEIRRTLRLDAIEFLGMTEEQADVFVEEEAPLEGLQEERIRREDDVYSEEEDIY